MNLRKINSVRREMVVTVAKRIMCVKFPAENLESRFLHSSSAEASPS